MQTAVEYLVEQLIPKALTAEQYYHIKQANKMFEQQIKDAHNDWHNYYDKNGIDAEQYYNETYKTNNYGTTETIHRKRNT